MPDQENITGLAVSWENNLHELRSLDIGTLEGQRISSIAS
jgi:hypothetical protein